MSRTATAPKLAVLLIVAALAFVVAGCGDDDSGGGGTTAETVGDTSTPTTATDEDTTDDETTDEDTTDDAAAPDPNDTAAVEDTIRTWILEGDCDLMTDKFLEAQTFDDNPKRACDTFEKLFTPPSYGADAIEITDVEIDGDKASAEVGGGGIDITSEYDLVFEDGTWKIDKASLS
ncbi:MAG: hypothetical protein M9964_10345 [Solirubrobacterales bacterium]|nr:hypothetical protein [Solirubrobacterales bacterium]